VDFIPAFEVSPATSSTNVAQLNQNSFDDNFIVTNEQAGSDSGTWIYFTGTVVQSVVVPDGSSPPANDAPLQIISLADPTTGPDTIGIPTYIWVEVPVHQ
jgi:hypothetical protein